MPTDISAFDAGASRASWDRAADAWEHGQASGRDYYRHEFFGPIQAAMCGAVEYTWRGWGYDFTTPALHVPLEDWFDWILAAGFQLRAFREPRPSEQALRERPELEDAAKVPYYVIFDLVRGAA
jgi:hypothetical protein